MDSKTIIPLFFLCFQLQYAGFSQNFQGIFQTTDPENLLVLSISEQGELLMGKLYQSDLSSKEFVARKEKSGFIGVFEVNGESEEVHGILAKKSLSLTLKAENKTVDMERVSKDLDYDFSKVFGKASKELKDKITGIWILKEKYKIEGEEKLFSYETGKDYKTAFAPDGKYIVDIKFLRDAEQEAEKKMPAPAHLRLKASDYFEMSQMLSWKVVGNNIHLFPRQAVAGFSDIVYEIEFEENMMILKDINNGSLEVYERKE